MLPTLLLSLVSRKQAHVNPSPQTDVDFPHQDSALDQGILMYDADNAGDGRLFWRPRSRYMSAEPQPFRTSKSTSRTADKRIEPARARGNYEGRYAVTRCTCTRPNQRRHFGRICVAQLICTGSEPLAETAQACSIAPVPIRSSNELEQSPRFAVRARTNPIRQGGKKRKEGPIVATDHLPVRPGPGQVLHVSSKSHARRRPTRGAAYMCASRQVACRCIILAAAAPSSTSGPFRLYIFWYRSFFFFFSFWCGVVAAVQLSRSRHRSFLFLSPDSHPLVIEQSVRPLCLCPCGWVATPCLSSSWSRFFLHCWLGGDALLGINGKEQTFFSLPPLWPPDPVSHFFLPPAPYDWSVPVLGAPPCETLTGHSPPPPERKPRQLGKIPEHLEIPSVVRSVTPSSKKLI